jgi:hypothetical protein
MPQYYTNTGPTLPPVRADYPPPQLTQTVAPTGTLGSLDECKAYLQIEDNTHDSNLALLLASESNLLEAETDMTYRPQTWVQTETCLRSYMRLAKWPLASVTVKYFDSDNVERTWTDYTLNKYPWPAIVLNHGASLPSTYPRIDAVNITLVCGGTVPPEAKVLCFARVGDQFEVKEYSVPGTISEHPTYERATRLQRRGPYIR